MNDDADFLTAIRAAPNDVAPRLIYADWLEEHGDVRAELIRVEEELRRLPVFADRYWELKPRGKALRAQAAPGWLGALGYGDWRPTFAHGIPDDLKERWRLIRAFTEVWYGVPTNDVGGRTAEIREAEARLGRTLPPSVGELVAYAYDMNRHSDRVCVWEQWKELELQLGELEGHKAVTLMRRSKDGYTWAVRHEHLNLPDPPVYGFRGHHDDSTGQEVQCNFIPDQNNPIVPSVSEFILDYAVHSTSGAGGWVRTFVTDWSHLVHDLQAAFPIHTRLSAGQDIYERDNILAGLGTWRPEENARSLWVEFFRQLPRDAVPAFLWDYAGEDFDDLFDPPEATAGPDGGNNTSF